MSGLETHDVPAEVEQGDWSLDVTGAVSRPLHLDRQDLSAMPAETVTDDFECEAGWVAEGLTWRGIRVGSLLDRAGPAVDGGFVLVRAMDGDYAASFRTDRVADALLAVGLDGEDLPVEHGGPARLVPTDASADCWESVKWVTELQVRGSDPGTADTAEEIAIGRLE